MPEEPRFVIRTAADVLNHQWDRRDTENEMAFRRGYFCAVGDIIDAISSGMDPRQLLNYYNGELWDWYFHVQRDREIQHPEMPEPWRRISKRILKRDNYICHYCGAIAKTTDHKIPVAKGGSDDDDNLVACCKSCNTKKRTKDYKDFIDECSSAWANSRRD